MDITDRIRARAKELNLKNADLARELDISRASVSQWFSGKTRPSSATIKKLAKLLHTTEEWLRSGKGPKETIYAPPGKHLISHKELEDGTVKLEFMPVVEWSNEEDLEEHGDYVFVPRMDIKADCGNGACVLHEEPLDQRQSFRAEWFKERGLRPEHTVCIYAQGDSMEPRIFEGDTLLVDRSPAARERIIDGKIYLIRYGDEIRVKQLLKRFDGGIIIRSFNREKYPDEQIPAEELAKGGIEVLGRVVWIGSEL